MEQTFKAVIGTGLTWDGNIETEEEKQIVDKLISKEYTLLTVFTKSANYKVNVSDFFSIARKVIPEDSIINNNDGNVILILATTKLLRWQKRKLLRLYRKYIK